MISDIQGVTLSLGEKALDAYELRHQVLANNIANNNVEGYQPLRVNFEDQLQGLRAAVSGGADDGKILSLLNDVSPAVESAPKDPVTGDLQLRLDDAMTAMVQNTVQYEAVLTALVRENALTRMAISGEVQ